MGQMPAVLAVASACKETGVKLSLFIEADERQVRASAEAGAEQVEFHTGHYCESPLEQREPLLSQFRRAARLARSLGLEVAAGHGLNRDNVGPICEIEEIAELNIGHSVVADAVFSGLAGAVGDLRSAVLAARGR